MKEKKPLNKGIIVAVVIFVILIVLIILPNSIYTKLADSSEEPLVPIAQENSGTLTLSEEFNEDLLSFARRITLSDLDFSWFKTSHIDYEKADNKVIAYSNESDLFKKLLKFASDRENLGGHSPVVFFRDFHFIGWVENDPHYCILCADPTKGIEQNLIVLYTSEPDETLQSGDSSVYFNSLARDLRTAVCDDKTLLLVGGR